MHGNELVTAVTIWTVGYVVGQIPVNLLLTRIRPAYVIGAVSEAQRPMTRREPGIWLISSLN